MFSINSPQFIKDNNKEKNSDGQEIDGKITTWLKSLNQEFYVTTTDENLRIKPTNRVILLAPCHETNSEFLNLVNKHVFNSEATIIYHQPNVDYIENFKKLYGETLKDVVKEDGTKVVKKVFYVDDNLISGNSFYDIYHLFRDTVEPDKKLTGAILLRDSSTQEMHDRFLRAVKQCRTFVSYNLPPSLSFDNKKPLEHERKRYADLRQFALHDVLIKIFDEKEQELNVDRDKGDKKIRAEQIEIPEGEKEKHDKEKKTHYINMFKTTHKVFDYFKDENIAKDKDDLLEHCYGNKSIENQITLLKVLSQYPSLLYMPLKEMAFEWHKEWLKEFLDKETEISKYDEEFCVLKFLIRRAVFLDNLQIIDTEFLKLISKMFDFTDKKLEEEKKKLKEGEKGLNYYERENYNDFPFFLVRTYLELAHKNGWAAVKLLENIDKIEKKEYFKIDDNDAQRFLRMLKIELAAVVNEFYDMLILQYDREWREIYRDYNDIVTETYKIRRFIVAKKLKNSNKAIIAAKALKLCNQSDEFDKFIDFLWIKQLIYADTHPKSYFPKSVNYQKKIDAIMEKMKGFFPTEVQPFFIVTDRQQIPYVLSDSKNILHDFEQECLNIEKADKNKLYYEIINFLNGKDNLIAKETTAEYQRINKESNQWTDCYSSEDVKLYFLDAEWLYLIRLSELEEGEFRTLGLFGFYSDTENLYDNPKILLPKQLLMLLRQDMSKFIKKHHKNDEFSGLIQQKLELIQQEEKADYQFLMKHGVRDYKNAITHNLTNISEQRDEYLKILFEYLVNKFNIISKLSTQQKEYEQISFQKIEIEFKKYNFIFTFYSAGKAPYSLEEVNRLVCFCSKSDDKSDVLYKFPKDYLSDLIFELLYNIRNHIIIQNKEDITVDDKLKINVYIQNNILYVENNHCTAKAKIYEDKSHGLNLLEKIWRSYELGQIIYDRTEDDIFKITIPLIKYENE